MTLSSKKAASVRLSNEDRRKRRKVSVQHECPLPSPPDLKISDYEPPTKLTKPLIDIKPLSQQFSIIHDLNYYMFKIQLDKKGNTGKKEYSRIDKILICKVAALCYLPTRYKNIVEFYHTVSIDLSRMCKA